MMRKLGLLFSTLIFPRGRAATPSILISHVAPSLHEDGESDVPVIVVQAEVGNNGGAQMIAGYRPLTGGNGICMVYQLEFLSEPDHRFDNLIALDPKSRNLRG
jgi:hypothetical protein